MKKLFLAVALVMGLGTSVAFANNIVSDVEIVTMINEFKPIDVKELPQAVQDAIKENYSEATIKEAEGQAEAVLKVQKANAEGLRMIKEAGADNAVLTLKSFEALAKVADGKSTKIIIPSELQNLAGLAASLKEVVVDEKDKKEE